MLEDARANMLVSSLTMLKTDLHSARVTTDAGRAITFRDLIHIVTINHKPRCQIMQDFNEALQMSHKNGSLTSSEELSRFNLIVFC